MCLASFYLVQEMKTIKKKLPVCDTWDIVSLSICLRPFGRNLGINICSAKVWSNPYSDTNSAKIAVTFYPILQDVEPTKNMLGGLSYDIC